MAWIIVAQADEIQAGKPKIVEVNGKQIGVFHEDGRYFAVLNYCPHFGAPICQGKVFGMVTSEAPGQQGYDHERRVLRCPWHRWEFDLEDGSPIAPIKPRLKTYEVRVDEGRILLDA